MDSTQDATTTDLAAEDTPLMEPAAPDYEPVDLDGNGTVDGVFAQIDSTVAVVAIDSDADTSVDSAYIDLNGDGTADAVVTESDGGYLVAEVNGNADPQWISREELTTAAPELVALLDVELSSETVPVADESQDLDSGQDTKIGDPIGDSEFWFQQAENGFCLPASIAQIVSEYTGVIYKDEMEFVDIANEIGAFSVGHDGVPGIPFEKGVEILNEAGVPAEYRFGDLESLESDLDAGYNIIVFVDSGELWTGEASEDYVPDHAVVITGIDTERGTVILSDPGSPGGNFSEVPIGLFMNSWADSENAMIVCDKAPDQETTPGEDQGATDVDAVEPGISESAQVSTQGVPTEATTAWAVQNPWILLPVSLLASVLTSRS